MICKNCANEFDGNFCPNCGEKKLSKHDLSIGHFFQEGLESFVHLDNKILRTLKVLLLKPGKLSLDFVEGKRVRHMKPLQLFLVLNLLLFLSPVNPFSLPLYNYVTYEPFTYFNTKEIVQNKLKETNNSIEELTVHFNQTMHTASKTFIFIYIPFYALIFFLFFWYRKKNFTEHLVFATHFISFYLLFYLLTIFLIINPFYYFKGSEFSPVFDKVLGIFNVIILIAYLFFALKKFYKPSIFMAIFCALAVSLSFIIFLQSYRMLLFFKIFHFNL
jgi:hypothetical protein